MTSKKITLKAEQITVPLDKLDVDPANVRLTDRTAGVESLADDIAAHGLLQNLGVRPARDEAGEATGRYLVTFGGRRLAALRHLVATKRLTKTTPIPCRITADEEATSSGLAENLSRIAMHPADAYEAFALLIEQGKTVDQVAIRFGISAQTVERRLRLGRLSPVILDAFRAGQIDEADAKAFAITTDTEAQERTFRLLESRDFYDAHTIKRMLTEDDVPASDRRVALVGIAAYEAAGGMVRRDLFADHNNGTLTDPVLLDRLAMERLTMEADRLRSDGWQDVAVSIEEPDEMRSFRFAPFERVPLSAEVQEQIAALIAESDALSAKAEEEELTDEEDGRADAIGSEIELLEGRSSRHSDETKAAGKAFVHLTWKGITVFYGLPLTQAAGAGDQITENLIDRAAGGRVDAAKDNKPTLSAALTVELHAQRTIALQAQVAEQPGLALRLLVQSLLLGRGYGASRSVAKISPNDPNLKQACPTIGETKAHQALNDMHDQRRDHEPAEPMDLLRWLLDMDDSQVLDVLAPLVAATIDAGSDDWSRGRGLSLAAQAAQAARLDMTDWWTPTGDTYFSRVSKAQIGHAVQEAGAGPFSTDGKKADLATAATRLVAGRRWLPTLLRMPPAEQDDDEDHSSQDSPDEGSLLLAAE